jgi:RNA polymerase sigma factor (sigma-70 family)
VAAEADIPLEQVRDVRDAARAVTSLDKTVGEDEDTPLGDFFVSEEAEPDREIETSVRGESVRRAVAELPSGQRRALFLAVYQGRTGREIAELEGIPLGTVKTRIRTAMLKLHDSLETSDEV